MLFEPEFLIVDLFCGAGGFTEGAEQAAIDGKRLALVIAAVNHDKYAIESHASNHRDTKHFFEDIRTLKMKPLVEHVRAMQLKYPNAKLILHASLECTNFSKAKGGKPRNADSRTLADHMDRYIKALNPDFITIENVVEFMSWGPLDENGKPVSRKSGSDYMKWRERICAYGYYDEWKELNSANYGAYTSRNRLFGIFAKHGEGIAWPVPTHAKKAAIAPTLLFGEPKAAAHKWKAVREVLNLEDKGESIFTRKKPLSEKTLERIYAGLIKFVAGGKASHEAFIVKYNSSTTDGRVSAGVGLNETSPVVSTQNRLYLAQPEFISKYYSGKPDGKNISTSGPAGTITTVDSQAIVSPVFIQQRNDNGRPGSKVISIEQPARTITATGGNQEVVQAEFIDVIYGNGSPASVNEPAKTLRTKDGQGLVQAQFIQRDFTGGGQLGSINNPSGAILATPKLNLVSSDFLTTSNFTGHQTSLDEPSPVITADRHAHYILNPQYANSLSDIEKPCFAIIARMDKRPPYLIETELGYIAIEVYETDSPCTKKIKQFMAMYGIIDIKMRMLRILELLKIQGFPANYILKGPQSAQKKCIGNAVVPLVPKVWIEALAQNIINHRLKAA